MSYKVENTYTFFSDTGYQNATVFFGVSGTNPEIEANQLAAYYDASLTIPAVQPLSIHNGKICRNGSPTNVYFNEREYSISVRDSQNVLLYTESNVQSGEQDAYLSDYAALRALSEVELIAGKVISLTDQGVWGDFILRNSPAHGLVDNSGTTIVINTDWYAERRYGSNISPQWFGCTADGVDDTVDFQRAADFAYQESKVLVFDGNYTVTKIILDGFNGWHWEGRGSLVGSASGTYDAVLELKNCSAGKVTGDIAINGSLNAGYDAGVLLWTDGGAAANYNDLAFSAYVNVKRAIKVGKSTEPDWAISENYIRNGYLFGVAQGIVAYGAQCVVLVDNFTNSVSDANWPGVTPINVDSFGATVLIKGGETLHALDTAGQIFKIDTISSATYGNPYGKIHASSMIIEGAAPLCNSSNTGGLSSPAEGAFSVTDCHGKHTQNLAAFIEMDGGFNGSVSVSKCRFSATSARTQKNILTLSSDCRIYFDDQSFGENMIQGDDGVAGSGVISFSPRLILDAYDTTLNSGLIAGSVDIIYDSTDTSGFNLPYHLSGFVPATGRYTVPDGGLTDITITVYQKVDVSGVILSLLIDGAIYRSQAIGLEDSVSWTIPYLASGTTIGARLAAGGVGSKTGGTQDRMQIFATRSILTN